MYSAHANINGQDKVIAKVTNLASLMYDVTHNYGSITDPEPAVLKEDGKTIGTVSFGHWTTDGRDVYFTFPNGAKKLVKLFLTLEESFDSQFGYDSSIN
jgi:hypothetical protein